MNKWRNVVSVVEVIIMLFCVIALITYFASKNENDFDNTNYTIKDKTGIIKQDYALEYLNKYVDELIFSGYVNEKSESYIEKEYDLVTPHIFEDLSDNDKLYLTISYLENAKLPLSKENVTRKYNEYFNTQELEYLDVTGCASYNYDETNEEYLLANDCLINSNDKLMVYKGKYERKDKTGIATIYVGLKTDTGIYTNLEKSNYYETDNIVDFEINKDNYQDFSEYTITFKEKDDSLYYFYSMSKSN